MTAIPIVGCQIRKKQMTVERQENAKKIYISSYEKNDENLLKLEDFYYQFSKQEFFEFADEKALGSLENQDQIVQIAPFPTINTVQYTQVTRKWLIDSILSNKVQSPSFYSPHPENLFSGMVVYIGQDIGDRDASLLAGMIDYYGGQTITSLPIQHEYEFPLISHYVTCSLDHPEIRLLREYVLKRQLTSDPFKLFPELIRPCVVLTPNFFEDCVNIRRLLLHDHYLLAQDERVSMGHNPSTRVNYLENYCFYFDQQISDDMRVKINQYKDELRNAGAIILDALYSRKKLMNVLGKSHHAEDLQVVFITSYAYGDMYIQALKEKYDCCTEFHIVDILRMKSYFDPRGRLLNYPWPKVPIRGMEGQVICLSNYSESSRDILKLMIHEMGARYSCELSLDCTLLVSGAMGGAKFNSAQVWRIDTVNHTYLEDCWKVWKKLPLTQTEYLRYPPGLNSIVGRTPMTLQRTAEEVEQDMIKLGEFNVSGALTKHENSILIPKLSKKEKISLDSPQKPAEKSDQEIRVLFTSAKVTSSDMEAIKKMPGIREADFVEEATHMIAGKIARTEKFLCGIGVCRWILDISWLRDSYSDWKRGIHTFKDEKAYILADMKSEAKMGVNIQQSIHLASKAKLLHGYKVYKTSGTSPSAEIFRHIVECNGGQFIDGSLSKLISELPNAFYEDGSFNIIILSCEEDEHLWPVVGNSTGLPIYSTELLLLGVLKQKLEFENHLIYN